MSYTYKVYLSFGPKVTDTTFSGLISISNVLGMEDNGIVNASSMATSRNRT